MDQGTFKRGARAEYETTAVQKRFRCKIDESIYQTLLTMIYMETREAKRVNSKFKIKVWLVEKRRDTRCVRFLRALEMSNYTVSAIHFVWDITHVNNAHGEIDPVLHGCHFVWNIRSHSLAFVKKCIKRSPVCATFAQVLCP